MKNLTILQARKKGVTTNRILLQKLIDKRVPQTNGNIVLTGARSNVRIHNEPRMFVREVR